MKWMLNKKRKGIGTSDSRAAQCFSDESSLLKTR